MIVLMTMDYKVMIVNLVWHSHWIHVNIVSIKLIALCVLPVIISIVMIYAQIVLGIQVAIVLNVMIQIPVLSALSGMA